MPSLMTANAEKIAALNDECRRTLSRCYLTLGITSLPQEKVMALLRLVANFDAFTPDNDPYAERDFGAVTLDGERYMWKVDYYDVSMEFHSPDPADPTLTRRVLTVMRADEY